MGYTLQDSAYYLTPEQIRRLIECTPKFRDRIIIKLFAGSGIRREELVNLTIPDINFEEKYIRVVGKGNSIRQVPISNDLRNDLKVWIGKRARGFVFPARDKKSSPLIVRAINDLLKIAGNLAGIKNPNPKLKYINPHILRHSYARIARDRGMPLESLQKILGHSNFLTTINFYGTKSFRDISRDAEVMAYI